MWQELYQELLCVCLEGAIIVLACIIFSVFAASRRRQPDAAAVTMYGLYRELVFNMLVLVGAVKMADRVVREMMACKRKRMKRVYIFKDGYSRQAQPQRKVRLTLSAVQKLETHRCFGGVQHHCRRGRIYPIPVTEKPPRENLEWSDRRCCFVRF